MEHVLMKRDKKYHLVTDEGCMRVRISDDMMIIEPCDGSAGVEQMWEGVREVNSRMVKVIVSPTQIMPEDFDA